MRILELVGNDIDRITMFLEKYADAELDFTDAAIIAIAEREGITAIATFDRRDFSIIQPRHTAFFELLPKYLVMK
jgi:predicted nucleic acid-binding protein